MKKPLLLAALVLAVLLLSLGVLLATFDADRYRPLLISAIEQSLGKPVTLSRLSLAWRGGLALQLDGLAVFDNAAGRGEPAIQVESASALIALGPLFRKDVQVASILLRRPRIRVMRNAQGVVNLTAPVVGATAGGRVTPGGPSPAAPALPSATPPPPASLPSGRAGAGGVPASVAGPARQPVSFRIRSLRIEDGTLHWIDAMARPPAEIRLNKLDVTVTNIAAGSPMDLDVRGALAGERSNLRLSGRLTLPGSSGPGAFEQMQFSLHDVPLEQVLPPVPAGEPQLRGRLTLNLRGAAPSLDPQAIARLISASGRVQLAEPVVANLNLLRAVFEKFSMIPGLTQRLQERLPPEYQAKFDATDTVLKPVDLAATLEGGTLRFTDVRLQTDTFGISGAGQVGLDGSVQVQSVLRIDPEFSQALIRSVAELQYLTNSDKEMELPIAVQGQLPRLVLVPDLQYVASRVIVNKATDLLGQWIAKQQGADEQPSSDPQPSSDAPSGDAAGELLGQFLRRTLQQDDGGP